MKLTPHDDINKVLEQLKEGLVHILGKNLIGIYLSGSLTYGDFYPGRSDIDVFVVVKNPVSKKEFNDLKKFHEQIENNNQKWAKRIECQYIPLRMFEQTAPPKESRPYLGEGKFHQDSRFGNEWIINNHLLYNHGVTLVGPDFKTFIKPINIGDVQKACIEDLFNQWGPKINDSEFFKNSHYHSYIILNLCRILYAVMLADTASKKVSTLWVQEKYPQWKTLIKEADNWKHGDEMKMYEETIEFIKFIVNKVKEWQKSSKVS